MQLQRLAAPFLQFLVRVEKTKQLWPDGREKEMEGAVDDLLQSGALLNYNGDDDWYAVHPALAGTPGFQNLMTTQNARNEAHESEC